MYAGKTCPKCGLGCNNQTPINGFEDQKTKLKKRFGSLPCNNCVIESLGGEKEASKIRSEEIIKEMGI